MSPSFKPEEINLFGSVLDRACAELPSVDDTVRELVGIRIIHAAEGGERDPDRLLRYALAHRSALAA